MPVQSFVDVQSRTYLGMFDSDSRRPQGRRYWLEKITYQARGEVQGIFRRCVFSFWRYLTAE